MRLWWCSTPRCWPYVRDVADRQAFGQTVRACGAQWISNESHAVWDEPDLPARPWGRFVLSLNGRGVAYTEAHGTQIDWFAPLPLTGML